jgi:hypothetical protein
MKADYRRQKRFLRAVEGCKGTHHPKNENVRKELGMESIMQEIEGIGNHT